MTEPFLDPNGNGLGLIPIKPQHCRRRNDNVAEIGSAQLSLGDDVTPHWRALTDASRQTYWEALGVLFLENANPNTDNLPLLNEAKTYNRVSGTDTYELLIGGEPWTDKVSLDGLKSTAIDDARQRRKAAEMLGFDWGGTLISFDEKDRNGLNSVSRSVEYKPTLETTFYFQNGNTLTVNTVNITTLGPTFSAVVEAVFDVFTAEVSAIVAATTKAELDAVTEADYATAVSNAMGGA